MALLFAALMVLSASHQPLPQLRPVHTFSIVARDPVTGQLGVAVQSHFFNVRPVVPWAEAGVGAVATQSMAELGYGPQGLALMKQGRSAQAALDQLLKKDPHRDARQVAMVDAKGSVAQWTGARCIQVAEMVKGPGFAAQSNLMENPGVPAAMAKAFQQTSGELADRLLAALDAAQKAGGDIRGEQSAALLVVGPRRMKIPAKGKIYDLDVPDSPQPLVELRRLLKLAKGYRHMSAGDEDATEGNFEAAQSEYAKAEALVPMAANNGESVFWHAVMLVNTGHVPESLPLFARVFQQDNRWRELVRRLPKTGQLLASPEVLSQITSLGASR